METNLENDNESITSDQIEVQQVGADLHNEDEGIQIYLSIVWNSGLLGAAYYQTDNDFLYIYTDSEESAPEFLLLKSILNQINPNYIIIATKADARLKEFLNKISEKSKQSTQEKLFEKMNIIQYLPNIEFSYDVAKNRIRDLQLPGMPQDASDYQKQIYLSSLINPSDVCAIRSIGGLLKYLDKNRIGFQLDDDISSVPILGIKSFSLKNIVTVNDSTYSALQIFKQEYHPSVYKYTSGMKEGLSLFGIFNKCKTFIGAKELRRWFLHPVRNIEMINQRLMCIEYLLHHNNQDLIASLTDGLKNIKYIGRIISKMRTSQASIKEWSSLYKTIHNIIIIHDISRIQPQKYYIFDKIKTTFSPDLLRIANLISNIVDFEESSNHNRFIVKPGFDETLDDKKRTYNGLPDFMTNVARKELNNLSHDIQQCSVLYLPQLGYLLAIPATEEMKITNIYDIPGLEYVFVSGNIAHYKSTGTRELDGLLGDIQCEITDQETKIMHNLQNEILKISSVLQDILTYIAQLDCLLALALTSREMNYIKPEIVNDGIFSITNGRHPLQELCTPCFVANSTQSNGDHEKVVIITGPNASGKSVYLKQVALIVYLAHVGSYVPAQSARISIVDHIFTRVYTLESVAVRLSTFMIDLNQISLALKYATAQSLVIIDEFGKGTEAVDGCSLLTASLFHWLRKGPECPHLLVSTHFHSVLSKFHDFTGQVRFRTMETMMSNNELVYLYKLIDGTCNDSHALHVAFQAGLPSSLIERIRHISHLLKEHKPIPPFNESVLKKKLDAYSSLANEFIQLDLDNADLKYFFENVKKKSAKF
ncbi:msh-5 [Cordylochernes scorpioides]|uniref:Msh-5 n=1 Tax=Cordylochernes scorpioides TaxID=51811 RepID=A0ABY6LHY9_9ARAC|nr:msh-5 [Cordylochernes scorpioides]